MLAKLIIFSVGKFITESGGTDFQRTSESLLMTKPHKE